MRPDHREKNYLKLQLVEAWGFAFYGTLSHHDSRCNSDKSMNKRAEKRVGFAKWKQWIQCGYVSINNHPMLDWHWLIILVECWPSYLWFCLSCTHLKENSNKIAKWDTKAHLLVQLVSVLRDNWKKHLQPHFRERLNNCYSEIMLKISECFSFEALNFSLQLLCMWVIIMLGGFNFLKCLLTSLIREITTRGNIARWLCVPWELDNRY